jgi:hypothetical protein
MPFEIARFLVDYSLGLVGIFLVKGVEFGQVAIMVRHFSGLALGVNRNAARFFIKEKL